MKKDKNKGKVAVLTGASSGIGKVIYRKLSEYGYTVICVCRRNPFTEEETPSVTEENQPQPQKRFYECDLSNPEQTEAVAEKIADGYKKIDLLINNAGLGLSGATELLPVKSVRYVFEVDYFAPLILIQKLLPCMSNNGKIVNISSACALFALPYRNVYCSAKAALNMLGYGLKMELRKSGIKVITVCPGDVKTEFTNNRIKYTDTNDRYGGGVETSQQKIDSRQNKRMSVDKVGAAIAEIAVKKKRALYIIGAKYKLLWFLSKIFSAEMLLKATGKLFN